MELVGWSEELVSSEFFSFKGFFVSRNVLSCARNYIEFGLFTFGKTFGSYFWVHFGLLGAFFLERHTWQGGSYGRETGWALWGLLLECLVGPVNRVC